MNPIIVTGLWDMGRHDLTQGFERKFEDHYMARFEELLTLDVPMFIYVPEKLKSWVKERRPKDNTFIKVYELEDIKKEIFASHWDKVQNIRLDPAWYNQTGEDGWLAASPQAALEWYNPVVMSKMFLLNNARIWNPLDSTHFYWLDAGITNTVSLDLLKNGWDDHICNYDSIWLSYPYHSNTEIHGFTREGMNKFCKVDFVDYVVRGGFFGGSDDVINEINGIYYNLLVETLDQGYMGTEESIFTIIAHRYPEVMSIHKLKDGWIGPFFEEALKGSSTGKQVALYVISYNTPKQFRYLLESIEKYDKKLLTLTAKYLINNTVDQELLSEYDKICEEYNFDQIRQGNVGITGGRELAAKYFHDSEQEYMLFFEDDMTLTNSTELCSSGFKRQIPNLMRSCIRIVNKENLDFLKLSFTEHFHHNGTQVSWYNLSQPKREEFYTDASKPPPTTIKQIGIYNGTPYAIGEVFFCNWPHLITKEGSKKIFSKREYLWPAENLVMAYVHEQQKKNDIKAGILLASPIQHDRIQTYDHKSRKEY